MLADEARWIRLQHFADRVGQRGEVRPNDPPVAELRNDVRFSRVGREDDQPFGGKIRLESLKMFTELGGINAVALCLGLEPQAEVGYPVKC